VRRSAGLRLTGAALGLVGLLAAFPGHGPAGDPGGDAKMPGASSGAPAWQVEPFVTDEGIRVVRIDPAAGDLWLLAGRSIHHRRADGIWGPPLRADVEGDLASMYVVRPGLIYGTAWGRWTIEQYRDGTWSTIGRFDACVGWDLPIDGLGETVAAGCGYYKGLAVWSASSPGRLQHRGRAIAPRELAVVGPGEVLALGVGGLRLVRTGEEEAVVIPGLAGHAPPRFLWANRERIVLASRDGEFHHASWDPAAARVGEWTVRRAPGGVEIAALGGLAPDDLVAVGRRGAILEFDGRAWSFVRSPTGNDLLSLAASRAGVWVGGAGGTLLRRLPRGA
jgi:hypothetical protein